jgi:glycerate kinase
MMKILLAPNAFKNSLTALEVGEAVAKGLSVSNLEAEISTVAIADGGDGSLPILASHLGAKIFEKEVTGPVGSVVNAKYAYNESLGLGIVELAEASGVRKISSSDLNPWIANTFGTGELIQELIAKGSKRIILTVGGSATVDGGMGILKALGVEFYENGEIFMPTGPCDFHKIDRIDAKKAQQKIQQVDFQVLTDVDNYLLGPIGAVRVFGPQKGISEDEVELFEESFEHWVALLRDFSGQNPDFEKAGASGGVPAAMKTIFGAEIINGSDFIFDVCELRERINEADIVITTEGQIDAQTSYGKGPGEVAKLARELGKKCIGICGQIGDDYDPGDTYFTSVFPINSKLYSLETAISRTPINLKFTAQQLGNLLAL